MRKPTIGSVIMLVAAPLIGSLMLWYIIFPASGNDAGNVKMQDNSKADYSDDGFIFEGEESSKGFEETGPKPGAAGNSGKTESISGNTTLGSKETVNNRPTDANNSNSATANNGNPQGDGMLGDAAARKEAKIIDAEKELKRAYKEMKKGKRH
jgi:hypothetical protein